ncbi:MAG: cellulose biosynthesis cyclic di-GMP-binding regulatory protein BcsB [Rhodovarius sp.]|nr:cellulose biosynthesis cyclic di-GMP-binding regulatory protein BcsB [Rhodovarius sp.]
MLRCFRLALLALGVWLSAVAGAAAQPPAQASGTEQVILRRIGLPDLGFQDGLVLEGLGTSRDVFFPVPRDLPVLEARLVLRAETTSLFTGRRGLSVLVNGRPVLTRPLRDGGERIEVSIPLDEADLARGNGFLRVTLRSSGALTDNRCLDLRLAGEQIAILEGTHLELRLPADAQPSAASLLQIMPREVVVLTRPGPLQPVEAAAALAAGHALAAAGRRVSFSTLAAAGGAEQRDWERGFVLVSQRDDGALGEAGRLQVVRFAGVPALALDAGRPDLAARLLAEPWRPVAAQPAQTVNEARPRMPGETPRGIALASLRGDLAAQDAAERASWTIEFSARDLPPGTRPASLALDIAAAPDTAGERAVAAVFFNEVLIGSQQLGLQVPHRMVVPIPEGLAGLDNRVRLVVTRRARGGDCETQPAALPAQLLPSSMLRLASASGTPSDFFELAPRWRDGVTILTDAPITAESLSPMLALLRTHVRPGSPLQLRPASAGPSPAPFLAFTADPPPGVRATPVRFDRGRLRLVDREGRPLLELSAGGPSLTAQLVSTENGIPGIWVRRAGAAAVPPALALDRGDVAFADAAGIALAFAAGRDQLVRVTYPDQPDPWTLFLLYRPWIIGGLWLALTAVFIGIFVRRWRRRNPGAGGSAA